MTTHCSNDPPFTPTSKVAIIGGGPAGLHMAHRLKEAGYENPIVLEAEQRLGGKSHTKVFDAYPSIRHELGTCYMHLGYDRIVYMLEKYGLGDEIVELGKEFTDAHEGFSVRRVWDLENSNSESKGGNNASGEKVNYERKDGASLDFGEWQLTSAFEDVVKPADGSSGLFGFLTDVKMYTAAMEATFEDVSRMLRNLVAEKDPSASGAKAVDFFDVLKRVAAPKPKMSKNTVGDAIQALKNKVHKAMEDDKAAMKSDKAGEIAAGGKVAESDDANDEFSQEFVSAELGGLWKLKTWKILASVRIFVKAMEYCDLHEKAFGGKPFPYGLPPQVDMDKAGIDCTFKEWIHQNELEALTPFFIYSQAAQGYGAIESVPAFYGLWWNSPEYVFRTFVSSVAELLGPAFEWVKEWLDEPNEGDVEAAQTQARQRLVRSGFSSLWENMAARERLDVRLGCAVTNIERSLDGGKHTITYTRTVNIVGDDDKDETQVLKGQKLEVDFIIVTVAAPKLLSAAPGDPEFPPVFKATAEEQAIFGSMRACHFRTVVARVDQMPKGKPSHPGEVWLGPLQRFNGQVRYISWGGIDVYATTIEARPGIMTYQIMAERPSEKTAHVMKSLWKGNCDEIGLGNPEILYTKNWDYFWHFGNESIKAGYPWKLLDLQGKHGMFFAGASACFESVIDVLAYNDKLLYEKLGIAPEWEPELHANFSGGAAARGGVGAKCERQAEPAARVNLKVTAAPGGQKK